MAGAGGQLPSLDDLAGTCLASQGNFAFLLETDTWCAGAVDHVRSLPLFYTEGEGRRAEFSNSARLLASRISGLEPDGSSFLEARMSGYVTGRKTLYKHLFQLLPGECFLFDKREGALHRKRYFSYLPGERFAGDEIHMVEALDATLDSVFSRLFRKSGDASILVPLSGGLDSRIVLCKLLQHGFRKIQTVSYGTKNNIQYKAAQRIAESLGVPWLGIASDTNFSRKCFYSKERRDLFNYADNLASLPGISEFECFCALRERGMLSEETVVINGQSGDFITGGHIVPEVASEGRTLDDMLDYALKKHFLLWTDLFTPENQVSIRQELCRIMDPYIQICDGPEALAGAYELIEWQERQCKLVVNAQRLYEFFGLKWEIPLWAPGFIRFWQTIPLEQKLYQALYKKYLQKYDYKGAFSGFENYQWGYFGGNKYWIPWFLRAAYLMGGKRGYAIGDKIASYFHHYGSLYAMIGPAYFLRNIWRANVPPHARGVTAFSCKIWLDELDPLAPARAAN